MRWSGRFFAAGVVSALASLALTGPPAQAAGVPPAAAPRDADTRIVNGEVASITDAPWQVGLLRTTSPDDFNAQFCGGSIVHPEWIVTAAHCVDNGTTASDVEVLAGKSTLGTTAGTSGPRSGVAAIHVHPQWNPSTYSNDVALLHLSTPLVLDGVTRTSIGLPRTADPTWPAAGTSALISGWGSLSYGGSYPTELHKATVDVITGPSDPACGNYSTSAYRNTVMLCGGTVTSPIKDTCQGDSGGPFAVNDGGTWLLAGITSWGDGCAQSGYPGVYSRVTALDSWIDDYVPLDTPGAPTGLQAVPTDRSAVISFTAPANSGSGPVSGYEYSVGGGLWTSGGTAASPVTVTGLENGTTVDIRLRAVNAAGSGAASAPVSVTPRTTPRAPTAVTAVPGDRAATVSFVAPGDNGGSAITGYEYSVDNSSWVSGGTSSPVTITGLTNGATYVLRLRAVNAAGAGAAADPVSVTLPPDPRVPGAPRNVTASPGDRRITVGFAAPVDDGGAVITGYEYALGDSAWVAAAGTSSPVTITGLVNGTAVRVRVRAVNAVGAGEPSASVTATPVGVPGRPGALRGTRERRGKVALRWRAAKANGGSVRYAVQVRRDGQWRPVAATTRTRWTGAVPGARRARTVVLRVGARNSAGAGPYSATVRLR